MDKPIKISVVVPCLNRKDYIEDTLQSILTQDYPHIECIVQDGGSTDGTLELLKKYKDRIKVFSEPDKGQGDAIMKGWAHCSGEYVTWLNADDRWKPGAVTVAANYLKDDRDIDVIYGKCDTIDASGNVKSPAWYKEWDLKYAVENCDHGIPQPASFIKREAVERVGGLDLKFLCIDVELWLRIGLTGKIVNVPEILAEARDFSEHIPSRFADDCILRTKKFFTLDNVPQDFSKAKAMRNACIHASWYSLRRKKWRKTFALSYLLRSLLYGQHTRANLMQLWHEIMNLFRKK